MLERTGLIQTWHDARISPGDEWADAIGTHLYISDVILLLISADFFASDYCSEVETPVALEKHQARTARAIPIVLRPVVWSSSPLAKLQALPKDALPVTSWESRDLAYMSICEGILSSLVAWKTGRESDPVRERIGLGERYSVRRRILDAALPATVEVGRSAMFVLLIRKPTSAGLQQLLAFQKSYGIEPERVQSSTTVPLRFPLNEQTNRPDAITLSIVAHAPEFEPPVQQRSVTLGPDKDSQPLIMMMVAVKPGNLSVVVELQHEGKVLVSCVVSTFAGDRASVKAESHFASVLVDLEDEEWRHRRLVLDKTLAEIRLLFDQDAYDDAAIVGERALHEFRYDPALLSLRDQVHRQREIAIARERLRNDIVRALELIRRGNYDEAQYLLHEILRLYPGQPDATELLRVASEQRTRARSEYSVLESHAPKVEERRQAERLAETEPARRRNRESEIHYHRPQTNRPAASLRSWRMLFLPLAIGLLLGTAILVGWLCVHRNSIAFTNVSEGSSVQNIQIISGIGWERFLNNYLVVEPVDRPGGQFIQGQIRSRVWSLPARFGDSTTPFGTSFYIYVISTPAKLSPNSGQPLLLPSGSMLSRPIRVTLRR